MEKIKSFIKREYNKITCKVTFSVFLGVLIGSVFNIAVLKGDVVELAVFGIIVIATTLFVEDRKSGN